MRNFKIFYLVIALGSSGLSVNNGYGQSPALQSVPSCGNTNSTYASLSFATVACYTGSQTGQTLTLAASQQLVVKSGANITFSSFSDNGTSKIFIEPGAVLNITPSVTLNGTIVNYGTLNLNSTTSPTLTLASTAKLYNENIMSIGNNVQFNSSTYTVVNGGSLSIGTSSSGSSNFQFSFAATIPASSVFTLRAGSILNLNSSNGNGIFYAYGNPGITVPAAGFFQYTSTDISGNSCTNPARINYYAGTSRPFICSAGCFAITGNIADNANIVFVGSTPASSQTGASTLVTSGTGYSATSPWNFVLSTKQQAPAPKVPYSYIKYCNGAIPATLSATGLSTASALTWYTAATGTTGQTTTVPTPAVGFSGTYYVSQTVNSCEGPRTAIVIDQSSTAASPSTSISVSSSGSCVGATLSLTGPGGYNAYSWTGPNSYTNATQSPSLGSATTAMSGTYVLVVTQGTGSAACNLSANANVTISSGTPATAPGSLTAPSTSCTQATLNWSSVSGATTYLLDVNTNNSFSGTAIYNGTDLGNVTTYNVTGLSSNTTYYFRLRAKNGCGTSGNIATPGSFTTNAGATAAITASSATTFCTGCSITLTASAGTTFSWAPGGETTQSITVSTSGSYSVSVTASGCTTTSSPTLVTVNPCSGYSWNGATSTDWTTPSNWNRCTVPGSTDDVTIPNPVTNMPSISGTVGCNNLTINSGSTLTNSSSGIFNVNGNFTLNGSANYVDNNSTLFNGTINQTITGNAHFKNMTVNNAAGVNLGGNVIIDNALTISTGTLDFGTSQRSLTVGGDLSGAGSILMTGAGIAHALNLAGTNNSIGAFTTTSGSGSTVNYNGSGAQGVFANTNYQVINISGTGTKTIAGNTTVNDNLSISSTLADGGNIVTAKSGVYITGSHTGIGKILVSGGTEIHNLSGGGTFTNLELNDSKNAVASSPITVVGVLTLTSGDLSSGGNLTIDLNTGAIAGTGVGTVTGNIIVTKNIGSGGFHYLSSPLDNLTVNDWNDNLAITGGNYYYYNEPNHNSSWQGVDGWKAITSTNVQLISNRGYALSFNSNTTLDATGIYSHGVTPANITLSCTAPHNLGIDGWNLVGNPYPSNIDWDAPTGWTKTNLYDAIYFWDDANQKYKFYVNGVGTASRYIPSMQGFYVRVDTTQTMGTFGVTSAARVTTPSASSSIWRMAAQNNVLNLSLSSGNYSDETILRITNEATDSFDGNWDAFKLNNGGSTPNFYSYFNGTKYSVNSFPLVDQKDIPFNMELAFAGDYVINATNIADFDNSLTCILEDKKNNQFQDLRQNPTYHFTGDAGSITNRFYIHLRTPAATSVNSANDTQNQSVKIYSSNSNINIQCNNNLSYWANIEIYDRLGRVVTKVEEANISSGSYTMNLPGNEGIFMIKVSTGDNIYTSKVYLGQ